MGRKVGIVSIGFEALARVLGLPDGHVIERSVCPSNEWNNPGSVDLVISGPQMPETEDGKILTRVMAVKKDVDVKFEFLKP